jgi:flagellar biogenesis protein FliO
MRKSTKESNLKPPAPRELEPEELKDPARNNRGRRTKPNKKHGTAKRATLRVQSKRQAGPETTKPKKVDNASSRAEVINEPHLLQTGPIREENFPSEDAVMVDRILLSTNPDFEPRELPQATGAPADAGTSLVITAAMHPEISRGPRILFSESNEEMEEEQVEMPATQTEVATVLEVPQSGESQSTAIAYWLVSTWKWLQKQVRFRHPRRRLRVCETVSLGEKRFVAVIEVDGEQFLVGGASNSVATLARLEPSREFSAVLKRRWAQEPIQA